MTFVLGVVAGVLIGFIAVIACGLIRGGEAEHEWTEEDSEAFWAEVEETS